MNRPHLSSREAVVRFSGAQQPPTFVSPLVESFLLSPERAALVQLLAGQPEEVDGINPGRRRASVEHSSVGSVGPSGSDVSRSMLSRHDRDPSRSQLTGSGYAPLATSRAGRLRVEDPGGATGTSILTRCGHRRRTPRRQSRRADPSPADAHCDGIGRPGNYRLPHAVRGTRACRSTSHRHPHPHDRHGGSHGLPVRTRLGIQLSMIRALITAESEAPHPSHVRKPYLGGHVWDPGTARLGDAD